MQDKTEDYGSGDSIRPESNPKVTRENVKKPDEENEQVIGIQLKRKALWTIVALAMAVLSVWAVASQTKTLTEGSVIRDLKRMDSFWTACGALAMIGFIWFEGEAIRSILKGLGIKTSMSRGFLYSAGDVYFSAITPSASGGQPASAFFMMNDGVSGAVTTAVLIMNLVFYTEALLTSGVFLPRVLSPLTARI